MEQLNRILMIKWGALGDLIAATTAIRAVRNAYPNSSITLLSNKLMYDVCPPDSLIDEIIPYEPRSFSFTEHLKVVREIRKHKFDAAINLRWTSERSAIILLLSGAMIRVGSGPNKFRWCYTVKAPLFKGRRHEFHRHLDIVKELGIPVAEPQPYVYMKKDDSQFAKIFFEKNGCSKFNTLIIHPGASISSKAWPLEYYIQLGRLLVSKLRVRLIMTWGPDEESLAKRVTEGIGDGAFMSPPTSIGKLAAMMNIAGLCVCNYSGAMNVAMAVQTPLVAIGCTSPEDWGPYGDLHRTVNINRQNDSYTESERLVVMKSISVEEVWKAIEKRWHELYKNTDRVSVSA